MSAYAATMRVVAAWLLVVVLAAPAALASDEPMDSTLWAQFVAWVDAGADASNGITADDAAFIVWLMSRLIVPGG